MIKYFIRTTGERTLHESFSQIDYELLIDYNHDNGNAFLQQLDIINEFDSVLMEDDIILCKDFKKRIEDVIRQYPNDVINFFTLPTRYFKTHKTNNFVYNQCTYFPKGIAKQIKDVVINQTDERYCHERMMMKALKLLNKQHVVYRPCLVQHIDNGSLMGHNVKFCRRSPYFIDYLDKLNIDYKDANLLKNRTDLITLMKLQFRKIDKGGR